MEAKQENPKNPLTEAKYAYLNRNLDDTWYTPDLTELAAEYDIDLAILKKIAKDENWAGQRYARSGFYKTQLAKAENEYLEEAAIDIAKVRIDLFSQNLRMVQTSLHKIHTMLQENVENGNMTSKDMISYMRLLLGESARLQTYIDENYKRVKQEVEGEQSIDKITDIIDSAKVIRTIEAIERGDNIEVNIKESVALDEEREDFFEKLDA